METITTYSVFHKMPWGTEVVLYFFLIGMSAGSFFLSIMPSVFGWRQFDGLSRLAWFISFILLLLCVPLLIHDLTQPYRFINLLNPTYLHLSTSPLAWGVLLLLGFTLFSILHVWRLYARNKGGRAIGIIGGIFAFALPFYTGFDIALNQRMPLAHSGLTPVFFIVLAITSGISLVIVIASLRGLLGGAKMDVEELSGLRIILLWSVRAILVMVISQALVLHYGGAYEKTTMQIINEEMGTLYWGGGFIIGTVIPLIILSFPRIGDRVWGITMASILIIIASYAYRYVIVIGSQVMQLYLN